MRNPIRFKRSGALSVLLVFTLLMATPAWPAFGQLTLLTSPGGFAHDATIDWTDLGPPASVVPTPAFFIDVSDTALAARVSEAPTANDDGFRRLESAFSGTGLGFDYYPAGIFNVGEQLLFTNNEGINTGNMGFDFSQPVFGFGMELHHPGFQISFDTRIEAFDSDGFSLGFFDVAAPGASSTAGQFVPSPAEFFGIRSATRNIASILFTPPSNSGGIVAAMPLVETGVSPTAPDGQSPATAIQPTQGVPRPEDGAWVFDDVTGTGRWFDPPLTSGYEYQVTDGLSNFVSVQLPTTIGDADNQFVVEDAVNGTVLVNGGDTYSFATPVDKFAVTGINPLVDGGDPLAFPTFLTFDQLTVSFTQTPLVVPEPSSMSLLAALTLCGLTRLRLV